MKSLTQISLFILSMFLIHSCELLPDEITEVAVSDVKHIGNDTILVGTTYGLFQSTNGGTNWNLLTSGLGNVAINQIDVGQDGRIGIATTNGFYHTENNGGDWDSFLTGKVAENVSVITLGSAPAQATSNLYFTTGNAVGLAAQNAVTQQQNMYLLNQGTTIQGVSNILSLTTNQYSGFTQVAAGTNNGVYVAPISTVDFTQSSLKEGVVLNTEVTKVLYDIDGNLYAGSSEGLYKSEDLGDLWTLNNNVTNITDLDINEVGKIVIKSGNNLLQSVDDGSTWSTIPAGLASSVNSFITLPNGEVLTGTQTGIFKLNGNSWTNLNLHDFIEL